MVTFARNLTPRHFLTSRQVLGLLLPALAIGIGWAWSSRAQEGEPRVGEAQSVAIGDLSATAKVRVLPVTVGPLGSAGPAQLPQQFKGVVVARRTSQLAAKQLGRVQAVHCDLGQAVKQGEILVELDRSALEADLALATAERSRAEAILAELVAGPRAQEIAQAESRVTELVARQKLGQLNLQRRERLHPSQAISQEEYDAARFDLAAADAQLAAAEQALAQLREGTRREQIAAQEAVVAAAAARVQRLTVDLDETRLVAPYDGVIQARSVDEGTVVAPGQPVLELLETDAYEIHVGVPRDYAARLGEEPVTIVHQTQRYVGNVARLVPSMDSATRTQTAILSLAEAQPLSRLTIGDVVTVEVPAAADDNGFWIPATALTAGPRGLWCLFVIERHPDGTETAQRQLVELVQARGDWTLIRGSLSGSEQVVMDGVHRLADGQQVRASSAAQAELSETATPSN